MSSILKKIKKLPDFPGVYFFFGPKKKILYIGKATSIRDRVRSYFGKDIIESRGPLIEKMLEEATDVGFKKTDSVLEALIFESSLIKKYKPKYNVKEKSDKSFNYVVITDEEFPRILIVRGKELSGDCVIHLKSKILDLKSIFGPFPQGSMLKEALKIVRKIFPFRDSCTPYSGRPCFNRQIGLCPGVCTGEISKKEYQKIIRNIKLLFEGKKSALIKKLISEMNAMAKKKEFEKANEIKKTLSALKHIQDISLIKHDFLHNSAFSPRRSAASMQRIEAYDVAHMAGKHIVGVMTVIEDGVPNKNEYRKFNVKTVEKGNDIGALKEILDRRLGHPEWQLPKLIVVDGGKVQINVSENLLKQYGIEIPVVGVVKDEFHRPKKILGDKNLVSKHEKGILLANDEAHHFAIAFHKKKRKIIF